MNKTAKSTTPKHGLRLAKQTTSSTIATPSHNKGIGYILYKYREIAHE